MAGWEVCLDESGDDVDRGSLGGDDQVNSGRPGELSQTTERSLDLEGSRHDDVGQLVDYYDDKGELSSVRWIPVVGVDVAGGGFGESSVSLIHFPGDPA